MIDISHQQARYLIRQGSDGRRLPEEQWAVLQSHLESCVECRAYRQRMNHIVHDLARELHGRWNPVHGPAEDQYLPVLRTRERRIQLRKTALLSGLVLVVVLLAFGFGGFWLGTAPTPAPTTPPMTIASPEPTAEATSIPFLEVLAYENRQGSNTEIYLLNLAGGAEHMEQVNLTAHPANDNSPSWSPDGEWLAFLSDRSGKPEVYVMHLAGSRLTQLTDDPTLSWQGPISWSLDGRHLALMGTPDQAAWWVYLVPLDGSGPRSLGLTRGVSGGVKFSPALPMLAYGASEPHFGGLMAYRLDSSSFIPLTREDDLTRGMRTGYDHSFEWSPDGYRLVYLAEGRHDVITGQPDGSQRVQMIVTNDLPVFSAYYDSRASLLLESQPGVGSLRSPAWVPVEAGRVIAYLRDADGSGCWTLHLRSSRDSAITPYVIDALCIEGGLSAANWAPDSQWVVLSARRPGEDSPGFYALRIPRNLTTQTIPEVVRLLDLPFEVGPDPDAAPDPQVRPRGRLLNIVPKAVEPFEPVLPPSLPDSDVPGQLIYNVLDFNERGFTSRLPGETSVRLLKSEESRTCPAISPSRERVAYLSDEGSARAGVNEIFVMDIDGGNPVQLSSPVDTLTGYDSRFSPQTLPRYGCPVWSPDGNFLAAVVEASRGSYLVLISPDNAMPMQFILAPTTSILTGPVWSPDGGSILLASYTRDGREGQILRVYHQNGALERLDFDVLVRPDNWNDVNGMAFSPDGRWLAYLTVTYDGPALKATYELIIMEVETGKLRADGWTFTSDARMYYGSNPLVWLLDNRIGLIASYNIDSQVKSEIFLYDTAANQVISMAQSGDVVFDSAWSPDGNWVILASETGLWALDILGIIEGRASPARLDHRRVYEVDWR